MLRGITKHKKSHGDVFPARTKGLPFAHQTSSTGSPPAWKKGKGEKCQKKERKKEGKKLTTAGKQGLKRKGR